MLWSCGRKLEKQLLQLIIQGKFSGENRRRKTCGLKSSQDCFAGNAGGIREKSGQSSVGYDLIWIATLIGGWTLWSYKAPSNSIIPWWIQNYLPELLLKHVVRTCIFTCSWVCWVANCIGTCGEVENQKNNRFQLCTVPWAVSGSFASIQTEQNDYLST